MMDGTVPAGASEGGSIPLPPASFFKKSFEHKLQDLEVLAEAKG